MWAFTHAVLVRCIRGSGFKNKVFISDGLAEGIGDSVFVVGADGATGLNIYGFPVDGNIALFDCESLVVAYFVK